MPLIKVYNNDSDPYGLKGHSIFKSVRPFSFGYAVVPKLCKRCLRHHVQAASAKAVSFRRTFGDEAWSQHTPKRKRMVHVLDVLEEIKTTSSTPRKTTEVSKNAN
jgi:hypothetical protein